MNLLSVKDLTVCLDDTELLHKISFDLDQHEGVALVGPNGAGKTTLLKAILGVHPSTGGSVSVLGKDRSEYTPRELARLIGYVPQRISVAFPYTVKQFVAMSRYAWSSSQWRAGPTDEAAITEAMAVTAIESLTDRTLPSLSGGEMQRVLVAAAIAQQPKILLLDEPAASLDPKFTRALHELLETLRKKLDLAVLSVSHDLNAAACHSSRILAVKKGEVVFDGTPRVFTAAPLLEELYELQFERFNVDREPGVLVLPRI